MGAILGLVHSSGDVEPGSPEPNEPLGEGPVAAGGGEVAARHRAGGHSRRPGLATSLFRRLFPWILVLAVATVVALLLRFLVFQTFFVPSSSMEPTLMPGDRMLVLKVGIGAIHRGEIIVFRRPPGDHQDPSNEDLVKRVIALPGQTIYSKGSTVYVDGKPIAQPWLPKGQAPGPPIPHLTVPKNDYFVMGDNRPVSYDSRYWRPHFVPRSYVIGEVVLLLWRQGHPDLHVF